VTHSSLEANQRPHISLIDRRHFDHAALPIGRYVNQRAAPEAADLTRPLDSVKPYQRACFAAPAEARSAESAARL
jgi:hypothetical protein